MTDSHLPVQGFLLSADPERVRRVQALWRDGSIVWQHFTSGREALEQLFLEPPALLVADATLPDMTGEEVIRLVKGENVYRQVCAVLCLDREHLEARQDWAGLEADDFIALPASDAEFHARVVLALRRATSTLDANPLTRLPGNTSIIQTIQGLIDKGTDFALAYADLDNFKAFNDKYGFSRGDEALMMAARVILNTVRSVPGSPSFVGHVGGDDFVFILPPGVVETACARVVSTFDGVVPGFYDEEDRRRGAIIAHDRQGNVCTFPLMAISIAVVFNRNGCLKHFGEASHRAGQIKKQAKALAGSSYVLDQRSY